MNLLEHVYAIQNLFNAGRIPEERRFSNKLVQHMFELNRAFVLKNQLNKNPSGIDFSYQQLCVPMELTSYADCVECAGIDVDCKIWRSKDKLPSIVNYREGLAAKVVTIDGNVIPKITLTMKKYNKYSVTYVQTKSEMFGYFFSSGHLYVISDTPIKMVLVEAIFEVPSDTADLTICSEEWPDNTCVSMSIDNYPLDASLVPAVYELTLKSLRESTYPQDTLNDTNPNVAMPRQAN